MAQPAEVRPEAAAGGVGCRVPAGPAGHGGLPIGFRFRPTDEELVLHYLRRKAFACPLPADIIPVADLARIHPSDLPGDADGERFFFHLPATRCWRKGGGSGRAGGAGGVWRASGKETLVLAPRCGRPVGARRTLVFCARGGRARTAWTMHEYRLLPAALGAWAAAAAAKPKDWVVCRVFKKGTPARRGGTGRRQRGDDGMAAPSPASSCVTEARGEEEVEGDEEIASF
ncbi:NAC domain-containing protein 83-like [Lolium rigidum]|uniref:NAC domain-containing protein 83-like n=1 Tax=Lolium rigidum TaxID=89674 RepID=UPI001F5D88F9|nr:NAC domain-containing protein 83-like [Lolium rigidum]